jgi:addiction module RelE/StbE family toxin
VKVSLSPEAQADLDEIARWIDDDNPERADTFVDELERACAGLGDRPLRFPAVPEIRHDLRKRVHDDYLIFYRVRQEEVEVVRIGHGARDWTALLRDSG